MRKYKKYLLACALVAVFGVTGLWATPFEQPADQKSGAEHPRKHLSKKEAAEVAEERELIQKANNAVSCGSWEEARQPLNQLVTKHNRWDLYETLAYVETNLGRYDDALRHYDTARQLIEARKPALHALNRQAGLARIFFNEGYLYEKMPSNRKPDPPCEQAEDNSHAAACYYQHAVTVLEANETRRDFRETLAYTHFALGQVYEARADAKDSNDEYREALRNYKLIQKDSKPTRDRGDAEVKSDSPRIMWNEWVIDNKLHNETGLKPDFPSTNLSCNKTAGSQ